MSSQLALYEQLCLKIGPSPADSALFGAGRALQCLPVPRNAVNRREAFPEVPSGATASGRAGTSVGGEEGDCAHNHSRTTDPRRDRWWHPRERMHDQEPMNYACWGEEIEHEAHQQMRNACRLPVSVAAALMPDAHVGYGLPIGGVLATENSVIPYAVGVDIACRVMLTVFDLPARSP